MSCTNQVIRFALSDASGVTGFDISTRIESGVYGLASVGCSEVGGVCTDKSGNIYIADAAEHCIIKIPNSLGQNATDPGDDWVDDGFTRPGDFGYTASNARVGGVSVVAGLPGTSGANNVVGGALTKVTAANARFNTPKGLCCDNSNNIYICDSGNNQIRKLDQGGYVTTVSGDTVAGAAGFVDSRKTLDFVGNRDTALFNNPYGICIDNSGCLYVTEYGNHSVRKIYPNGTVLTISGNMTHPGPGDEETAGGDNATYPPGDPRAITRADKYSRQLSHPRDCSVDASGTVYVLDSGNYKIKKITADGALYLFSGSGVAGTSLGTSGTTASTAQAYTCSYTLPMFCDIDRSNNLYVVDNSNTATRLLTINKNGAPSEIADFTGTAYVNCPIAVAVDPGQKLFVTFSDYDLGGSSSSSSSSSSVDSSSTSSSSSSSSQDSSSSSSVDSSSSISSSSSSSVDSSSSSSSSSSSQDSSSTSSY